MTFTEENTSRTVRLKSGEIHYHEAGAGHPLVFLHGSGPGATGWSNFAANMRELAADYRCIAVDMPGWGRSHPVTFEERDHPATAVELLDALGIDKAAFIGNSMGGATALRLAVGHSDRVSHLVTMGAGAGGTKLFGPAGPTEGIKVLTAGYRDPSPETMGRLVDIMSFDSGDHREELARQRSEAALAHPEHLANFLAGVGRRRPWPDEEELAAIPVPTLLIHGRDDRVVHYENALRLLSLIPDSRAVLLNRCGHWAQVEHAAEFNRLVGRFVAGH